MWAFFDEKTNVFPSFSSFCRILEVEMIKGGTRMKELIHNLEEKQEAIERLKSLMQKGDILSLLDVFQLKVNNRQAFYFLENTQEICQNICDYLHEHVVHEPFYCKIPTTSNTCELYLYHRETDRMCGILNLKDRDIYHISSPTRLHFTHVREVWESKNSVEVIETSYQNQKEKTEKEWKWRKKLTLPKKRKELETKMKNYFHSREELIRMRKREYEANLNRYETYTKDDFYETYQNGLKHILSQLKTLGFQYDYVEEELEKEFRLYHSQCKNTSYDLNQSYSHDYFHCLSLSEYPEKEQDLSEILLPQETMEQCQTEWKNMFGEECVSELTEENGIYTVRVNSPKGTLTFSSNGIAIVTGAYNTIYSYLENENIHGLLFGKRDR